MKKAVLVSLLIVIFAGAFVAAEASDPYKEMAPLEAYLIDERGAEVAMARSAAPTHISKDATILVLTKSGYETAVKGSNGFVCLVDRSWTGPFANPEFWNPRQRSPICYNEAGARSVLPLDLMRTDLALAGVSKEEMETKIKEAFATGKLRIPEPSAMSIMMSPNQYLGDQIDSWRPHLMFYMPYGDFFQLGAVGKNAPAVPFEGGGGAPMTTILVPLPHWSDGSEASWAE